MTALSDYLGCSFSKIAKKSYTRNFAARFAIKVATAPAATPESMLTTANPKLQDCNMAINVATPFSPKP